MRKISIEKSKIEQLLHQYKYKKIVCKHLGICIDTLNTLINEYGIEHQRAYNTYERVLDHPEINKEWLITNWVNTTKSMRQLSEEFNVPESLIDSRRTMYKVVKHYKHYINKEKLFDLTDPKLYYLAGLVATDGYVPAKQNAIELSLVGADEEDLLQQINTYYENSNSLVHYGRSDISFIRIVCPGLNAFLQTYFSIPDGPKTFTVGVPITFPTEDCAIAYVRGCLDGDGSISKSGSEVGLTTASEALVRGIKSIIERYIPEHFSYYVDGGKYPTLSAGGKKCRLLLDWVYSLDNCFRLERKYKRYLNYNS